MKTIKIFTVNERDYIYEVVDFEEQLCWSWFASANSYLRPTAECLVNPRKYQIDYRHPRGTQLRYGLLGIAEFTTLEEVDDFVINHLRYTYKDVLEGEDLL